MQLITIPRKAPLILLALVVALNAVLYVAGVDGGTYKDDTRPSVVYAEGKTENVSLDTSELIENVDDISEEDIDLIALITMAEAEGESELGKRLVIDTILNRVDSEARYFPDTIYDVVYQKNAFESVWNGRIDRCYVKSNVRQLVLEELENRTNYDVVYFTAGDYGEYGTPLFQEDNHYFSGH